MGEKEFMCFSGKQCGLCPTNPIGLPSLDSHLPMYLACFILYFLFSRLSKWQTFGSLFLYFYFP